MAADPNAVEQVIAQTLRDNLEKIKRTADDLHQSVNDLVAACAGSHPGNTLPPMVRAQASAASLSATLEVLTRFVTSALPASMRSTFEPEISQVSAIEATAPVPPPIAPIEQPAPVPTHPTPESAPDVPETEAPESVPPEAVPPETVPENPPDSLPGRSSGIAQGIPWITPTPVMPVERSPTVAKMPQVAEVPAIADASAGVHVPAAPEIYPSEEPVFLSEPVPVFVQAPMLEVEPVFLPEVAAETQPESTPVVEAQPVFNLDSLLPEEQELHRRAYRVAKVSMQDIKMLRPEDVRIGRENKDLCFRLRDDIEKAHKEYDRRFQSIQSHPVDYFYDWMVEILAGGDPQALGEYPYPSPVLRR